MKFLSLLITVMFLPITSASAACNSADKLCVMEEIKVNAAAISKKSWRDTTYRELAKSYTHEGHEDKALALIALIERPDTKAMTIRGIGTAAADNKWADKARYDTLFKNLTLEAEKITHAPSYAIAYTYIAMAQAFAGDDAGAFKTAKSMKNEALRNKAFGESAEIQAERSDYETAMESIAQINSLAFRNKAHGIVAKIFTKQGELEKAYQSASKIDNAYAKAQAFQQIVNHGNAEEALTK
jgi:hypothetical protein